MERSTLIHYESLPPSFQCRFDYRTDTLLRNHGASRQAPYRKTPRKPSRSYIAAMQWLANTHLEIGRERGNDPPSASVQETRTSPETKVPVPADSNPFGEDPRERPSSGRSRVKRNRTLTRAGLPSISITSRSQLIEKPSILGRQPLHVDLPHPVGPESLPVSNPFQKILEGLLRLGAAVMQDVVHQAP